MIVLTGGAGFIGSCFLRKLNDEGISDVFVVDRLGESEKWKNLTGKKFIRYFHKDDFRKRIQNGDFGASISAIIHFGACSSTTELDADYLFDNNLEYSKVLADYAERHGIKFIYASSAATYGDGSVGYSDKEIHTLKPLNCYGFTKQLFDVWVTDKNLQNKFTGLKFFNVFGPNEYHKGSMASMVFKAYNQIKDTGKVKLFKSDNSEYKDGEQKRDFIYVKDAVEIVWQIYKKNNFAGLYNLGSGKAHTWNQLINAVFKAMDKKANIEYVAMPDELKKKYQYFTQADMNKLQESEIEFKIRPLEDSVADYIQNHLMKENPIW